MLGPGTNVILLEGWGASANEESPRNLTSSYLETAIELQGS
jgi:hypothetical protein